MGENRNLAAAGDERKASVLIVTLAILAVLAILSISFARLMMLEKESSRNYSHARQAIFLAEAGLRRAIASLTKDSGGSAYNTPADRWAYTDGQTPPYYNWGMDIRTVGRWDTATATFKGIPSYYHDNDGTAGPTPGDRIAGKLVSGTIDKVPDSVQTANSISAPQANTYGHSSARNGYVYTLKILDTAGQININYPNKNLITILERLGWSLVTTQGASVNPFPVTTDASGKKTATGPADEVFNKRPAGGWGSKREIIPIIGKDAYEVVKDYITCYGWFDPSTARPDPKFDVNQLVNPTSIEARPPVNINTAPMPVLVALIWGLKGYRKTYRPPDASLPHYPQYYYDKGTTELDGFGSPKLDEHGATVTTGMTEDKTPPYSDTTRSLLDRGSSGISEKQAIGVANAIVEYRKTTPFKTWKQFHDFVGSFAFDELDVTTVGLNNNTNYLDPNGDGIIDTPKLTAGQMDVLKVNFNPNTLLNRFHPNRERHLQVDKGDLVYYTTEFSFFDMGHFEITSLGEVYNQHGELEGFALKRSVIAVKGIYRHSSQKDFQSAMVSNLDTVSAPEATASGVGATPYDGWIEIRPTDNTANHLTTDLAKFYFCAGSTTLRGQILGQATTEPFTGVAESGTSLFGTTSGGWTRAAGSNLSHEGKVAHLQDGEDHYFVDNKKLITGSSTAAISTWPDNYTIEFFVKGDFKRPGDFAGGTTTKGKGGGKGFGGADTDYLGTILYIQHRHDTDLASDHGSGWPGKIWMWSSQFGKNMMQVVSLWGVSESEGGAGKKTKSPAQVDNGYLVRLSFVNLNPLTWQDWEWHHIAYVVTNKLQLRVYVDGKIFSVNNYYITHYCLSGGGPLNPCACPKTWPPPTLISGPGYSYVADAHTGCHLTTVVGDATTPAGFFQVGSTRSFDSPTLWNSTKNNVVDLVKLYPKDVYSGYKAASLPYAPSRYKKSGSNTTAPNWEGYFENPTADNVTVDLRNIAWTQWVPEKWSTSSFETGTFVVEFQVRVKRADGTWKGADWTYVPPTSDGLGTLNSWWNGAGYAFPTSLDLAPGERVHYRMVFKNYAGTAGTTYTTNDGKIYPAKSGSNLPGADPMMATHMVDDVTIIYTLRRARQMLLEDG